MKVRNKTDCLSKGHSNFVVKVLRRNSRNVASFKTMATLLAGLLAFPGQICARTPDHFDCSGVHNYPFMVAITELQNKGKLQISDVDFSQSRSDEIATRQISRNLQRQVLHLEIHTKGKKVIDVMVVNYASKEECSMPGTKIYLLSLIR